MVVTVVFGHYRMTGSHDNMCCTGHTEDHSHTADRAGMSHHSDPDRTDLKTTDRPTEHYQHMLQSSLDFKAAKKLAIESRGTRNKQTDIWP